MAGEYVAGHAGDAAYTDEFAAELSPARADGVLYIGVGLRVGERIRLFKQRGEMRDIGFAELRHPCRHIGPDRAAFCENLANPGRTQLCPDRIEMGRNTAFVAEIDFNGSREVIAAQSLGSAAPVAVVHA
jgi:hypothetical protein